MLDYDALDKSDNVTKEQARCLVVLDKGPYVVTLCGLQIWKTDDQRYTHDAKRVTCMLCGAD